jgi:hypothetical protein
MALDMLSCAAGSAPAVPPEVAKQRYIKRLRIFKKLLPAEIAALVEEMEQEGAERRDTKQQAAQGADSNAGADSSGGAAQQPSAPVGSSSGAAQQRTKQHPMLVLLTAHMSHLEPKDRLAALKEHLESAQKDLALFEDKQQPYRTGQTPTHSC